MSSSINVAKAAKIFKALSDQNRLAIVLSLLDGAKTGTEILKSTAPFSQPTLSHHLAILCESEVLDSRRNGKTVVYSVNTETAGDIAAVMSALSSAGTVARESVSLDVEIPVAEPKKAAPAKKAPARKAPAAKPAPKPEPKPAPAPVETPKEPEPEEKPAPRRRSDDFDFFD